MKRYARQTVLPEIGVEGQARLKKARVLCVGVGGLGSPASLYLAAAGVGTLGLVDFDRVDETNLQRQILFQTCEVGELKVEAAKKRLVGLNPEICIETFPCCLSARNVLDIFARFDIIIDGTDNFAAKFLINDAAVRLGLPVVYGSISRFEGQVSVFWAKHGACYRCLYPALPETRVMNCAEAGVLGAVAGIVGSMQAAEAVKLAIQGADVGPLKPLIGTLLVLDCATMGPFMFRVPKVMGCPVCAIRPEEVVLADLKVQACVVGLEELSAGDLARIMGARDGSVLLVDVREAAEWQTGHIEGAVNIPLSQLRQSQALSAELTSGARVILYCHSGARSEVAGEILMERGLRTIAHLSGGISAWQRLRE